jgi:hypothetical protein
MAGSLGRCRGGDAGEVAMEVQSSP